jgi:2-polyprenyl-3-methyl-5-hydroxy-6-metoxy-1,4-benzoquinol methylase
VLAAPAAAPVTTGVAAWQSLAGTTGVQVAEYPDAPRINIRQLFVHKPQRVLDIGCATGAVSFGLKETYGAWTWGCELDTVAAQRARSRLDRVTTRPLDQWSGEDLELLSTVDTVLLLDVLEHMYNPWAQLQRLSRHLLPQAQVIVSLPNAGHAGVIAKLAGGSFSYELQGILDVTHIRFFTKAEMLAMFEQTGFTLQAHVALSGRPAKELTKFPAEVRSGTVTLRVESRDQWHALNTIQFGFCLRRAST